MPLLMRVPYRSSGVRHSGPHNPEYRGVHEEPFTYGDAMKVAAPKYKRLPLVVVNHTYNDYMGGRASLSRTGARGTADTPDSGERAHVRHRGRAAHQRARQGQGLRRGPGAARLVAGAARATGGTRRLWVRWPRLAAAQPPLHARGARWRMPEVLHTPAYLPDATVMVPKLDADHNPVDGVRAPRTSRCPSRATDT